MSGLKMFAPLHLGTFTDTLFYMHEHEHPSVLVQLHWCPSILREEALCSRLRCLPRALQLPKLDCAKHNWLVRSSLNVKSEGMPCRCTHIRICVFIIYIYTYLYMHIKLYVPDMFKHVFISHLYMFWAALYVCSFEGHELRNQLSRIVVRLLFDQREGLIFFVQMHLTQSHEQWCRKGQHPSFHCSLTCFDRWMCSQFLLALRSQVGIELAFVGSLRAVCIRWRGCQKYCTVLLVAWIQGPFSTFPRSTPEHPELVSYLGVATQPCSRWEFEVDRAS